MSREPSLKQKAVAKNLLENVGKPIGKAMLEAGYSPAMAKNPDHLTKSKGWAELMEQYLPDDKVLKVVNDAFEANKVISSHSEPDYMTPDHPTRLKAAELSSKLKGKLIDKSQVDAKINVYFDPSLKQDE